MAIARIELLYPFPRREVRALLAGYPNLQRVVWAQGEPSNMGARKFVLPTLRELLPTPVRLDVASRPERSAPAEGYHAAHRAEQARIVAGAFGV